MRLECFMYGLLGIKTPSMIRNAKKYPKVSDYSRLGDLRWSLTHIMLWQNENGWFMLFPYGGNCWFVSRKQIIISNPLFAFDWRKKKYE